MSAQCGITVTPEMIAAEVEKLIAERKQAEEDKRLLFDEDMRRTRREPFDRRKNRE